MDIESGPDGAYDKTVQNHETPTSQNRKRPANHIPRPPNAFLLYRSDFLKGGKIPQEETKQQNLSRIAGECWQRLDPIERAYWHTLAKKVEVEHARRYPDYVYKPARRGSVLKRRRKNSKEEEQRRCEELRKIYIPETIDQLAVKIRPVTRKRRSRTKKKAESILASTSSLHSDGQLTADAFGGSAFMEPLLAPPNFNEQSLKVFHEDMIPESSPPKVNFNLGYPGYSEEYYDTLGVDHAASPQIPQASLAPTTFANEPYEKFQRDKAAGLPLR